MVSCTVGGSGQQVGEISFLVSLEPLPELAEHTAVDFPDLYQGYITRTDGVILYSGNSGLTWEPLPTPTTAPLYDVAFIDPTLGFAVGGGCPTEEPACPHPGAVILESSDSGESWELRELGEDVGPLHSLVFTSTSQGVAVGEGVVLTTSNTGTRWDVHQRPGEVLEDVWMESTTRGFTVGKAGLVLVTDDGGQTWTNVATEHTGDLFAVAFADGVGYIAGELGLLRSFDDGQTWNLVEGAPSGLRATYFLDLDSGIVGGSGQAGAGATLLLTNDYGDNWLGGLDLDTVQSIRDFSFPNDDLGFAVGNGDQLIKLLRQ